jgi:DNA-binding PadR family transcriptional regulator
LPPEASFEQSGSLQGRSYYQPTQEGREKLLAQRMEEIRRIRAGKHGGGRFFEALACP